VVPLVHEAFNWQHGTFLGSIVGSEITAAAAGKIGELRRDPFAMLPFCGYHMGDYFSHWLEIGKKSSPDKLPKIFYVNWFRKSADGKWLWPGYGENSRVLKWIIERTEGSGKARKTPIGFIPTSDGIDISGLSISKENMDELLKVEVTEWKKEIETIREHYKKFGDRMPKALWEELVELEIRLLKA
jgi:Phosphoenolpyruvate carboxykinase (GTP)